MKNLKDMLKEMSSKAIDQMATDLWDSYQDDGEDGIGSYLDVDPAEAAGMLECTTLDEFDSPADLADAMRVYREDGSEEAYLRAELRRIKAREAEIKARLKELEGEDEEEQGESLDTYKVFKEEGEEALKEKLGTLDAGELRRIIKDRGFDRSRRSVRWKEDRLVELIVDMTATKAKRGEVFRNYED